MASKLILLSGFLMVAIARVSCQQTPTELFSTRTFYDAVRGSGITPEPGCTPVALWTLIRAGAHYPSSQDLRNFAELDVLRNKILDNHNKWRSKSLLVNIGGDLPEEVLESLEQWTWNVDPSKAGYLIESGQAALTSFIQRLQSSFPHLLHSSRANRHNIQHNGVPKSIETYNIITSTLYNTPINASSGIRDTEESFGSTSCPRWAKALKNAEVKAQEFRNSNVMKDTVLNVSRRLGFNRLDYDLIQRVYKLCTYDRAISPNQSSPWCSIFTTSELEVFEYEEDILTYYSSGQGNPDYALIGCDFIRVFLQNFSVYKTNADVNIQVARGLLIRESLATLGLATNEPPVNSENFEDTKSRLWRNSLLTPFNGNLVAVLNECGEGLFGHSHYVSLFMNENPIEFPFCGNTRFCEISEFQRQYQEITDPSFCRKNVC